MSRLDIGANLNDSFELMSNKIQPELVEVSRSVITAFNEGNYDFVDEKWRMLPSDVRKLIMVCSTEYGDGRFVSDDHFNTHKNDRKILDDEYKSYSNIFSLSDTQAQYLLDCSSTKNEKGRMYNKACIISNMKKYNSIVKAKNDITYSDIKSNLNLLLSSPESYAYSSEDLKKYIDSCNSKKKSCSAIVTGYDNCTLDKLRADVTDIVKEEEIPDAISYIRCILSLK